MAEGRRDKGVVQRSKSRQDVAVYIKPLGPSTTATSVRVRRRRGAQASKDRRRLQVSEAQQKPASRALARASGATAAATSTIATGAATSQRHRTRFNKVDTPTRSPHTSSSLSIAPSSHGSISLVAAASSAAAPRPVFEPFATLVPLSSEAHTCLGDALSATHFVPPLLAASVEANSRKSEAPGLFKLPAINKPPTQHRPATLSAISCPAAKAPRTLFFDLARLREDRLPANNAAISYIRHTAHSGISLLPSLLSLPRDGNVAAHDADELCIKAIAASNAQCFALASAVRATPFAVRTIQISDDGGRCEKGVVAIIQALMAAATEASVRPTELNLTELNLCCKLNRKAVEQALIPLLSGRPYDGSGLPVVGARCKRKVEPSLLALAPVKLSKLSIARSFLGEPSLVANVAQGLRRTGATLTHLDCSDCCMGEAAAALASAFSEEVAGSLSASMLAATLRKLNLSSNGLHGKACAELLRMLRRFGSALRDLDLSKNSLGLVVNEPCPPVSTLCVVELAKWLAMDTCAIQHLDVRSNSMDTAAIQHVAKALRTNRKTHIHCGAGNPGAR